MNIFPILLQADIIIALHKSPSVRDTMGIEDESLVFAELDSIVDELIAEGCAFGCPHRFRGMYGTAVHSVVCRDVYCSLLCQQTCLSKWHMLECCSVSSSSSSSSGLGHVCGRLSEDVDSTKTSSDDCSHHGCNDSSSTSSMMHDFTTHANRTNEIFFAVRRVLTTLISCCTALSIEIMRIDDVIDWFLGCFPLIVTDNSHSSSSSSSNEGPLLLDKNTQCEMNDEAEESWLLLFSALVSEKHVSVDRYGKLLSRQCFSQVLFIANQHLHSLVINVSRSDHSSVVTHLLNYLSNRRHAVVDVDGHSHATTTEKYMEKLLAISNCGVGGDVAVREALRSENTLNLIADLSDASSLSSSTGVLHHQSSSRQPLFPAAIKHTGPVCMVLLTQCSKASRHSCLPNAAPCLSSRTTHPSDGMEAISWEDDLLSFLSMVMVVKEGVVGVSCRTEDNHSYGKQQQQLPCIDLVALRPFVLESTQASSNDSFIHSSEPLLVSYVDHTSQSSDANVGDEDGDEDRYAFTYRNRWMQLSSRTKMVNKCYCIRCRYEEEIMQNRGGLLVTMSIRDIITLAHFYMQQAAYSVAKRLYYTAIHRIETTPHATDDDSFNADDSLRDAYHALGAVYLECMGGQQWEMARYVWMRGAATMMSPSQHALLSSEVDKIKCYPSKRVHVMKAPQCHHKSASLML